MTFLVRKMRATPELAQIKVVLVTDRTQLQGQLNATMQLAGENTDVARNVRQTKQLLSRSGPGIVFVMIQKQQDIAARKAQSGDELTDKVPSLGELNTDDSIVVMVDEAHRSHGSQLHNNLLDALPNCARIGFTGTPIIMGKRKKTTEIFGTVIDQYGLSDAEKDGAVVKIFYEGNTVKGAVRDGRDLDDVFEDMFAEQTDEEREELQRRYATRGDVLEAKDLVAAKARHLLRHYVGTVLPGGFKAQLVAHSRKAAVRYRDALIVARDELVRAAESLPEHLREVDPREIDNPRRAAQIQAYRHLALLKAMDFVPVISVGTDNDEQYFSEWTDAGKQDGRIKAFKKLIKEKRRWIYGKLAERDALGEGRPPRQYVSGEGFPYLGRSYRLLVVDEAPVAVRLVRGRLQLRRDCLGDAPRHLVQWYRARGESWLRKRLASWAIGMNVQVSGLKVRPLGYRWASCSPDGSVNIYWAAMQLSPDLLDYVLVHELAHLDHHDHGPDFWRRVERTMPDHQARRDRLRRLGPDLWLPSVD
jgi:predicted metal-dependent hydrolase